MECGIRMNFEDIKFFGLSILVMYVIMGSITFLITSFVVVSAIWFVMEGLETFIIIWILSIPAFVLFLVDKYKQSHNVW